MKRTYKRKRRKRRRRRNIYTKKQYNDKNGMLTSVWGPSLWHFLHTMSFNYPVHPTIKQKKKYKEFILDLQYVLPCGHCRKNIKKNLKCIPLLNKDLKNRNSFSRWMYTLHEKINKMLGKKSGLTFPQVRDRYEHFRSRCTKKRRTRKKKEKGCVDAMHGPKSKCVIKIVPQNTKCKTFQMDKRCLKK